MSEARDDYREIEGGADGRVWRNKVRIDQLGAGGGSDRGKWTAV